MNESELTIVIATYNERQTLPQLVSQLRESLPQASILVVDDNSPDGTGDWVRENSAADARLQLLHRESKEGLGAATLAGICKAMERRPEKPNWIATMDGDLSHRVVDLKAMWNAACDTRDGSCGDVIIGSRYVKGGRIENWSPRRRIASRCVNWFARWCLWLKPRDNSGALRIYSVGRLEQLDFDAIDCQGFAYLEQILLHLQRGGAAFHEVPIVFSERAEGESKVTLGELFRNLRDVMKVAVRRE